MIEPRKPRWNFACLVGLTRNLTGDRRIYRSLREPSAWKSSYLIWDSNTDSRPLSGAKLKWPGYELPIQQTPGPRRPLLSAGAQLVMPVNDRFMFEMPKPTYPRPDRQLAGIGTRPITNRFVVTQSTPTPGNGSLPPKAGTQPVIDRFVETPSIPTLGHGSPPPRAGTQPMTVRFVETLTMPTPEYGSPPWQAGIQPGNDRFIETSLGAGKQRVTARVAEIPTLPAPGLDRQSWRTEMPWGTDVRGSHL